MVSQVAISIQIGDHAEATDWFFNTNVSSSRTLPASNDRISQYIPPNSGGGGLPGESSIGSATIGPIWSDLTFGVERVTDCRISVDSQNVRTLLPNAQCSDLVLQNYKVCKFPSHPDLVVKDKH
jgi:hypothetical protein